MGVAGCALRAPWLLLVVRAALSSPGNVRPTGLLSDARLLPPCGARPGSGRGTERFSAQLGEPPTDV